MLSNLIFNLISYLWVLIMVLVAVGFFTLFERKLLGYVQKRKGPNKVGILGLFQPFSDAIKLFSNELFILFTSSYVIFFISPFMALILMFLLWNLIPLSAVSMSLKFSFLMILSFLCLTVYPIIYSGWSSGCNYSMVGSIRGLAQAVSYESAMFLVFFPVLVGSITYSCKDENNNNICAWVSFLHIPLYMIWITVILAELNRTPFDLVEGESELVSGFNTEYFSSLFGVLFMAEYGMIIYFSFITTLMFTSFEPMSLMFMLFFSFNMLLIVLFRGSFPRLRYDQLMFLCWKVFLPFLIFYTPFIMMFKIMVIYILN